MMVESHESKQQSVVIHRNKYLYEEYINSFPFRPLNEKNEVAHIDRDRLLNKGEVNSSCKRVDTGMGKRLCHQIQFMPILLKVSLPKTRSGTEFISGQHATQTIYSMLSRR